MQYYSESRRPERIYQPKCNRIEPIYQETIDKKTGKEILKKVDEVNVYEKIQAASEGSTLHELIQRYKINIDESLVEAKKLLDTEIKDYTKAPSSLMEAMEIINTSKSTFEGLSKDLKLKFNNSFSEFLAAANNGTLEATLKSLKKQPIEQTIETKPNTTKIEQINQTIETIEPTVEPIKTGVIYE